MPDFSETELRKRIVDSINRALGMSSHDESITLRMGSTPGWDSMGHMTVVMEVEKEFGVRFASYELPNLIDVPSIENTLILNSTK